MNLTQALLTFHIIAVCCTVTIARPLDKESKRAKKRQLHKDFKKLRRLKNEVLKLMKKIDEEDILNTHSSSKTSKEDYSATPVYDIRNNTSLVGQKVNKPQIACPRAEDNVELTPCPTPDKNGDYTCIDDHALCDGVYHCPNGEDENGTICMFHKLTMKTFRLLTGFTMQSVQARPKS